MWGGVLATIEDFSSFFPFILGPFYPFFPVMSSLTIHHEYNETVLPVSGNNFRVQTIHRSLIAGTVTSHRIHCCSSFLVRISKVHEALNKHIEGMKFS